MRSYLQSTLGKSDVYGFVSALLRRHLELCDYGRTCPVRTLLAVLLFAATRRVSLSRAAEELREVPSDLAGRNALHAQLSTLAVLEDQLNAALADRLPRSVRRGRHVWAIDLHQEPYDGKPDEAARELRSGKPRQGTTWFHTVATVYVVRAVRKQVRRVRAVPVRRATRQVPPVLARRRQLRSSEIMKPDLLCRKPKKTPPKPHI